jgi:thiamine pyrophosphokinase
MANPDTQEIKTAALFLNGEAPNTFAIHAAMDFQPEYILCTDGAFNYMNQIGIQPDCIIGDMDSLHEVPRDTPIQFIDDQDTTDFEKALYFLAQNDYKRIVVLGSTGGQNDHFLGNLNAAYKYRKTAEILFFDNEQHFFLTESFVDFLTEPGKVVSLFPFPSAHVVSMRGLKYTLSNASLDIRERVGTRNIATDSQIQIELSSGALWIFVTY